MSVKVIDNPQPDQTTERLVKLIHFVHSSKASKVLAEHKLKGGDITIVIDSHETRNLMEEEEDRTKVIAGRT
jgi:hypothetical protein